MGGWVGGEIEGKKGRKEEEEEKLRIPCLL